MKLKYYLRGLGIGIVVTALIFMITSGKKEELSDAEIRERAAQLGMVDASSMTLSTLVNAGQQTEETPDKQDQETTLSEMGDKPVETEQETTSSEQKTTSSEAESKSVEAESESKPSEEEIKPTESETAPTVPETTPSEAESKPVATITIGRGADSYSVSKDLEAAGLIENAREYDAYLCENGYSKRISIGTYEIPIGTSQEEIAKIITGKR